MTRTLSAIVILLSSLATFARADDMPGSPTHKDGALGFHDARAPIGLRWWFKKLQGRA